MVGQEFVALVEASADSVIVKHDVESIAVLTMLSDFPELSDIIIINCLPLLMYGTNTQLLYTATNRTRESNTPLGFLGEIIAVMPVCISLFRLDCSPNENHCASFLHESNC